MFKPTDLFDLSQTQHAAIFEDVDFSWQALQRIKDYIAAHMKPVILGRVEGEAFIGKDVMIGEGTVIEPGAMIKGPAIIGKSCQIRHNAYLRENVIVGDDCVIGNSSELKNALLLNGGQVPHFNYVGDSILGYKAHLGAGVILSNLRSLPGNVQVQAGSERIDSGLRKFGALVGDRADVGCNCVLNPGSIIGRGSIIYPGVNWRGCLPPSSVAKNRAEIAVVERQSTPGQ
ncbi:MAG TPA: UDP-N-acetylglucosamine diphosphorylase [Verrucomicrobiae bacterium]|nr:UDP-N-acetylglucosamine diphosphorylase [Verrucomicrobiae bacterium]